MGREKRLVVRRIVLPSLFLYCRGPGLTGDPPGYQISRCHGPIAQGTRTSPLYWPRLALWVHGHRFSAARNSVHGTFLTLPRCSLILGASHLTAWVVQRTHSTGWESPRAPVPPLQHKGNLDLDTAGFGARVPHRTVKLSAGASQPASKGMAPTLDSQ